MNRDREDEDAMERLSSHQHVRDGITACPRRGNCTREKLYDQNIEGDHNCKREREGDRLSSRQRVCNEATASPRRGKGAREKSRFYLCDGQNARASSRRIARVPRPSSLPNPTSKGDGNSKGAPHTTHRRKGNPHCRPLPQPNPAIGEPGDPLHRPRFQRSRARPPPLNPAFGRERGATDAMQE